MLYGQRLGELGLPEDHRDRMINGDAFVVEPCPQISNSRLVQVKWKESRALSRAPNKWNSAAWKLKECNSVSRSSAQMWMALV